MLWPGIRRSDVNFINDHLIEKFALGLTWSDLPKEVCDRAQMCGLDLFTSLILGSKSRQYNVGCSVAEKLFMSGTIPVFAEDGKKYFNLLGATISFSHAANSFDNDDGFNLIKGHPGASFVGGALAAALEADYCYRDYLTLLVVCYELTIRWALVMQDHYGYLHSSGAYGAFGTALAVGRARKYDEKRLNTALSSADSHAPMVPAMRSVEYPSMNKDGIPFGSFIGAMAAVEAEEGETGRTHLLESTEARPMRESLGVDWLIRDLYFKPYTCCRWAHQPIDCCIRLRNEYGFCSDQVESVTVYTFEAATRLNKQIPADTEEAQYNIAFPVACALIHGDVGYEQICDEAVGDRAVLKMMDRLSFVVSEDFEKQFPEKRLSQVEINLTDGRTLRSEAISAAGESDDPNLCMDWVIDKFLRRTKPILDNSIQRELLCLLKEGDTPLRSIIETINTGLR